eukprot:3236470-Amphidinium_carterae.1
MVASQLFSSSSHALTVAHGPVCGQWFIRAVDAACDAITSHSGPCSCHACGLGKLQLQQQVRAEQNIFSTDLAPTHLRGVVADRYL